MENTEDGIQEGERGGVVTARGTGDGLVIRLDGSVDPLDLRESLATFMTSRKAFLEGNEVALEWVGAMPDQAMIDALSNFLTKEFTITVKESRFRDLKRAGGDQLPRGADGEVSPILSIRSLRDGNSRSRPNEDNNRRGPKNRFVRSTGAGPDSSPPDDFFSELSDSDSERAYGTSRSESSRKVSLFDGIEVMNIPGDSGDTPSRFSGEVSPRDKSIERTSIDRGGSRGGVNPLLWDDPDARIINTTLRSGQRVESDHSIIVKGDVNSGAEVIAGGDIVILGTLRGIAHAGAFDDTGGGRSIVALSLQPTQLRIGSLISRGKSDSSIGDGGQGIEVARIEGNIIVVEPYQVRGSSRRNA